MQPYFNISVSSVSCASSFAFFLLLLYKMCHVCQSPMAEIPLHRMCAACRWFPAHRRAEGANITVRQTAVLRPKLLSSGFKHVYSEPVFHSNSLLKLAVVETYLVALLLYVFFQLLAFRQHYTSSYFFIALYDRLTDTALLCTELEYSTRAFTWVLALPDT